MARGFLNRRLYTQLSHVTTPIFYPNAKPHLGHLYSSLLCDVFHRWQLFKGNKSLFTTGTDEHGLKIQLASQRLKYANPKAFVDALYKDFIHLDKASDVRYTRFIRTTDQDHIKNVKELWNICLKNGYIYKGDHDGWYSISDETFYPESRVIKDPKNADRFINTETYNEVIYQSETNYFFRLSAFKEKLIDHLLNNPTFIYPDVRYQQILRELQNTKHLRDLSVSRPSSRLKWGIDVPEDPSQKVYVWFDALCNYISSIGGVDSVLENKPISTGSLLHTLEYDKFGGQINPRDLCKNTTHLVGKDIIKFHAIYWPSFLMAAGLPLPKRIVVHSHWLSEGVKMSKSLGNVVDPIKMINHYGADPLRWFLLENSQLEEDGDFQEDKLHKVREMLAMKWGNLINRCCGSKFNLSRAVDMFSSVEKIETISAEFEHEFEVSDRLTQLFTDLDKLPKFLDESICNFQTRAALKAIWSLIDDANTFIQISEPWARSEVQQDAIIYTCMELSRIISILCQPIIPDLSSDLLDRIDVAKNKRTLAFAKANSDNSYGRTANARGREAPIKRIALRIE